MPPVPVNDLYCFSTTKAEGSGYNNSVVWLLPAQVSCLLVCETVTFPACSVNRKPHNPFALLLLMSKVMSDALESDNHLSPCRGSQSGCGRDELSTSESLMGDENRSWLRSGYCFQLCTIVFYRAVCIHQLWPSRSKGVTRSLLGVKSLNFPKGVGAIYIYRFWFFNEIGFFGLFYVRKNTLVRHTQTVYKCH